MTCAHTFVRSEELMSAGGGYIAIQLDEELFVDAEVCASCRAVELVLHDDAAKLVGFATSGVCRRCNATTVALGHSVVSQGGTEIHAPLDARWTFGLLAFCCARGHITLTGTGSSPLNAELLVQHPNAGTCACGGTVHAVDVESHHSGPVSVGEAQLRALICIACERVRLDLF